MPSSPASAPAHRAHAALHRRPPRVGSLLRRPREAAVRHMQDGLRAAGHDLHRAHMAVFQEIDHEGSRLTALAERCGVTKQTMVHLVDDLERRGYLERLPDRADGRAKVVSMTERGWRVHELGNELVAELDRRWAACLGRRRLEELRRLLADLDGCLDEPAG
jgi:DNA-binding MarR family transcriptional regulator